MKMESCKVQESKKQATQQEIFSIILQSEGFCSPVKNFHFFISVLEPVTKMKGGGQRPL